MDGLIRRGFNGESVRRTSSESVEESTEFLPSHCLQCSLPLKLTIKVLFAVAVVILRVIARPEPVSELESVRQINVKRVECVAAMDELWLHCALRRGRAVADIAMPRRHGTAMDIASGHGLMDGVQLVVVALHEMDEVVQVMPVFVAHEVGELDERLWIGMCLDLFI